MMELKSYFRIGKDNEEEWKRFMNEVDTDGSGDINQSEFVYIMMKMFNN